VNGTTATVGVCLYLAIAIAASAQTASPAQAAEEESVRRQENTILLRQRLAQAEVAQKAGDNASAARLYQEAYSLSQRIGVVGVEKETQKVVAGLSDVQLRLAQQAQNQGDLASAETWVNRILAVDPKNQAAQNYKKTILKLREAQKGRIPSDELKARVPEMASEKVATGTLVQDGRMLLEWGKLDEAEKKLQQAFDQDPSNAAAVHYLRLVKEKKYEQEARRRSIASSEKLVKVEEAWNPPTQGALLPTSNPFATTNSAFTGPGRQVIQRKLERIKIDEVRKLEDLPLGAVVAYLSEESRLRDPEKEGVNFIVSTRIDKPVPQAQLMQQMDPTTGLPVQSTAPTLQPVSDLASDVTIRFVAPLRKVSLGDILEAITKVAQASQNLEFYGLKYSIEEYGVVISQKTRELEQLYSKQFRVDPNTFLQGLESVQSINPASQATGGDNQNGNNSGGNTSSGSSGSYGSSSSGGEIPRVVVAAYGGSDNQQGGGGYGGGGGGGGGYGGGQGGGMGGGLGGYSQGGLTAVTRQTQMSDVQTLVRSFFAQATGIYFAGAFANQNGQGGGQGGYGAGGGMQAMMGMGMGGQYGGQQGQPGQLGTGQQQGIRTMFFNDRTGVLFVRATMEELDLIEQAVQVLNLPPPMVNLEAKFVEISQEDNKALGFDWILGNTLMGGGNVGLSGGSAPSYVGSSSTANPSGIFPGSGGAGTVASSAQDGMLTSGLRNNSTAIGTVTGIMTDPQFRLVIRALEQRTGVDVMSAPNITTLSGRQAQIQSTVQRQIFASVSAGTGGNNYNNQSGGGVGGTVLNQAVSLLQPSTVPLPTGPTLDVIPYVSADGYTIQMTLIPSILDFLGYGNPDIADAAAYEASIQAQAGQSRSPVPLPRIQVRQITTSATVWDGQTIVLGGLISDDVRRTRDKVPVLGDIPLLGRLFRSETSGTAKKNLVVFVTAKIIDPAGNRVHSEDNLPYDPNTLPVQKPMPLVSDTVKATKADATKADAPKADVKK
jgi:type II secretory pathway component GspD/PulD (secretin)/tetratricopeptide (TPR) repeat protein